LVLEKLGINPGYLFLQIINFAIVALLLQLILFKPVAKMLRERRERIAEGLNNARKADEALAGAEASKQRLLDDAHAEVQHITNEAHTRAEEAAAQIKADAHAEAERILEDARQAASAEHDRVMADMRDQIIALSLAAANRLLGANLSEERQRQIVEDFFTSIPPEAKDLGDDLTVVTAVPLRAEEQARFKKELSAKNITFKVEPSILGGVIVRAGGQQVDGSFAHQLTSLRTMLS
jgi:F-type H+-transporting ATPase subunit b